MSKLFPGKDELGLMTEAEQDKFWAAMAAVDELADERKAARSYRNDSEADHLNKQLLHMD